MYLGLALAKKKTKSIDWKKVIFFTCLVAWPILQFCVFYIGVNFKTIINAFTVYDETTNEFIKYGFDNFVRIFSSSVTEAGRVLVNPETIGKTAIYSLIVYAVSLFISLPLGLFLSFYIAKKMPAHGFFRVLLFLPSIIPIIALSTIYMWFVDVALPAYASEWFGIPDFPHLFSSTDENVVFATIIFFNTFISGFGVTVLLYSNAMSKVSPEVIESAHLDGAKGFKEFWHITLPAIFPTLAVFVVAGIAGIFTNQANLYSFMGGNNTFENARTFGYLVYKLAEPNQTGALISNIRISTVSALGLAMTAVAIPLTFLARYALNKLGPSNQ